MINQNKDKAKKEIEKYMNERWEKTHRTFIVNDLISDKNKDTLQVNIIQKLPEKSLDDQLLEEIVKIADQKDILLILKTIWNFTTKKFEKDQLTLTVENLWKIYNLVIHFFTLCNIEKYFSCLIYYTKEDQDMKVIFCDYNKELDYMKNIELIEQNKTIFFVPDKEFLEKKLKGNI